MLVYHERYSRKNTATTVSGNVIRDQGLRIEESQFANRGITICVWRKHILRIEESQFANRGITIYE